MKKIYVITYVSYMTNVEQVYCVGLNKKVEAETAKKQLKACGHTNVRIHVIFIETEKK